MRQLRVVLSVLVTVAALAACSDDGGGSNLSDREQAFADSFAVSLTEDEDGLGVSDDEATCMGEAIMDELGVEPFEAADLEPNDVEGDKSPGELLGDGVVSDDQANAILGAWKDCVDLTAAYIESASGELGLDDEGKECLEDGLKEDDILTDLLRSSFTSGDPDAEPDQAVIGPFVELVQTCSVGESGEGGLLVDSLADSFATDGSLTEEQARCVAQYVVDAIGSEGLISAGDLSSASPEVQRKFTTALNEAAEECDVNIPGLGG